MRVLRVIRVSQRHRSGRRCGRSLDEAITTTRRTYERTKNDVRLETRTQAKRQETGMRSKRHNVGAARRRTCTASFLSLPACRVARRGPRSSFANEVPCYARLPRHTVEAVRPALRHGLGESIAAFGVTSGAQKSDQHTGSAPQRKPPSYCGSAACTAPHGVIRTTLSEVIRGGPIGVILWAD